jgi:putative tryptophan/tyrosine transport system substrate-binding protein
VARRSEGGHALARAGRALDQSDTAVLHGTFYTQAFQDAAATLGIAPVMANVFNLSDIETTIVSLVKQPGGGLIIAPDTFSEVNGDLIVSLAAQHRLPTVYAISSYARRGG